MLVGSGTPLAHERRRRGHDFTAIPMDAAIVMASCTATISYGQVGATKISADCITTVGPDEAKFPALTDPASAVREAIAHPLEFPSLDNATVPGDRVAIALDPLTPSAAGATMGALAALRDAGVESDQVTVVCAQPLPCEHFRDALAESHHGEVQLELHDPGDEEACAMVAVGKAGEALRMNRAIAEADFVLTIAAARAPLSEGAASSPFAGLYPTFADAKTQRRWRQSSPEGRREAARRKMAAAADEAGWLVGALFVVHLVPAGGGGIAGVYAGEPRVVARAAAQRRTEVWSRPVPDQADLVIATLRGDSYQQSWPNLGRALEVAEWVTAPEGAVVVCCDLADAPGKLLRRLAGERDLASAERLASRDASEEGPIAAALCRALQRGPVYLRSRLDDAVVEQLGMTPVASDAELDRLAARRGRCVVIEDAHRVELVTQLSSA